MSKANPISEIEEFLNLLFEGEVGYVYAPTKDPNLAIDAVGYWNDKMFKWPQKRQELIQHILTTSETHDSYVAPAVFKAPNPKKQGFKHSRFIWCEFDGNAPKMLPKEVPEPTIKVQSSVDKHEHWYWRLQEPLTDQNSLENLSKNIAYMLEADKSGWDCNQVLRPPGSIHQESNRRVKFLNKSTEAYSLGAFAKVIVASVADLSLAKFSEIPDATEVIQKYKWPEDARDLFNKETQPIGARSSAMTRLGFHCIEMGMSNEEAYSILFHADERWGKFKNRSPEDRRKRLLGIITHCRSKKEVEAEVTIYERDTFLSLGDFLSADIKVDWLFSDFLPLKGMGIIGARPGVGKSTLSLRMCTNVALGQDFLIWKNSAGPMKAGFLSLEMGAIENKKFILDMLPSFNETQLASLKDNFFLLPLGYAAALSDDKVQRGLLDEIERTGIQFLVVDSLKAATQLDEQKLDKFYNFIDREVRDKRGVTVWIIHHNRKADKDQGSERSLDDLFGDTFIAAHPTTVIMLTKTAIKDELRVHTVKNRLAEESDPFLVKRTKNLEFTKTKENPVTTKKEAEENDGQPGIFNRRET